MSTETYEYEKINAKDKPIAEDFVYVYSEIEDGGFRKVSKAMLKVLLGVATKLSELENDKAFITKTVLDLENYYLKSDTYSKDEIDNRISLIPRFDVQVVSSLPTTNISETTVYLVSSGDDSDNLYTEYINVNGLWEILGTQKIASVENAVLYTAQSLTEEQKTQARTNISAASSEDVRQVQQQIADYKKKVDDLETIVKALQDSMGSVVRYGKLILSDTEITIDDTLTATFTVKLNEAPTESQIVALVSDNDKLIVSPVSINFTSENYDLEQEITISIAEPSAETLNANVTVSTENDTAVISVVVTESESAIEWYTLTNSDMTYTAQSSWNRTILSEINTTDKPNIIIPSTIEGYPTMVDGLSALPESVKNLKFEDGSYYLNDVRFSYISSAPNTNLENIYGVPSAVKKIIILYCDALKTVDLSKVKKATSINITYNNSLLKAPQINNDITGLTSLEKAFWNNKSLKSSRYNIPDAVINATYMLYMCGITEFTFDKSWEHLTKCDYALMNNPIERVIYESDVFDSIGVFNGSEVGGTEYFNQIVTHAGNITFVVNFNSAMYKKIRYMQSSEDYACRNLRLEMKDEKQIKNISFWGDSLTRRNEIDSSHGYMVEQFSNCMADDVMSWNYGCGGTTSASFATYFDAQPQRYGDVSVIWLGTNDTGIGGVYTVENIKNYINKLTGDYIVIMPWGWGYDSDNKDAFNNAGFGDRLLNVHEYVLQNGFNILGKTPNAEEQQQLDEDNIPDIYIDTSDHTHLTKYGGQVISMAIKEKLLELGYISEDWLSEEGKNTSVSVSTDTLSVDVGATGTITATTGNGANVTWSSTDESIATVVGGVITGVASGSCYVIARCGSYSKFCAITVN